MYLQQIRCSCFWYGLALLVLSTACKAQEKAVEITTATTRAGEGVKAPPNGLFVKYELEEISREPSFLAGRENLDPRHHLVINNRGELMGAFSRERLLYDEKRNQLGIAMYNYHLEFIDGRKMTIPEYTGSKIVTNRDGSRIVFYSKSDALNPTSSSPSIRIYNEEGQLIKSFNAEVYPTALLPYLYHDMSIVKFTDDGSIWVLGGVYNKARKKTTPLIKCFNSEGELIKEILVENLLMANDFAVSKDGEYILIAGYSGIRKEVNPDIVFLLSAKGIVLDSYEIRTGMPKKEKKKDEIVMSIEEGSIRKHIQSIGNDFFVVWGSDMQIFQVIANKLEFKMQGWALRDATNPCSISSDESWMICTAYTHRGIISVSDVYDLKNKKKKFINHNVVKVKNQNLCSVYFDNNKVFILEKNFLVKNNPK